MSDVVVDASTVLAIVLGEAGGAIELPAGTFISAVNYAEVRSRLHDLGFILSDLEATLELVGMEVVAFDVEQAVAASSLREQTRSLGLSLGDRACLALAMSRNVSAITADRAWEKADLSVDIQMIR